MNMGRKGRSCFGTAIEQRSRDEKWLAGTSDAITNDWREDNTPKQKVHGRT
jgi:hypothetical protein